MYTTHSNQLTFDTESKQTGIYLTLLQSGLTHLSGESQKPCPWGFSQAVSGFLKTKQIILGQLQPFFEFRWWLEVYFSCTVIPR